MPISQTVKKISPLDRNKNVTIGVAFPLDETNMFIGTPTTTEQVKSNLINLLMTEQGERLYEPNFGVGIQRYLFEQDLPLEDLEEKVKNQVRIYIPEILIDNIYTNTSEDGHKVFLQVVYTIMLSGDTDSIRLNINT